MGLEYVSSCKVTKPLMPTAGQLWVHEEPLLHPLVTLGTTDWCPNPALRGEPPGEHLSSYQEQIQMQARVGHKHMPAFSLLNANKYGSFNNECRLLCF